MGTKLRKWPHHCHVNGRRFRTTRIVRKYAWFCMLEAVNSQSIIIIIITVNLQYTRACCLMQMVLQMVVGYATIPRVSVV